jgi:hypothetical protein
MIAVRMMEMVADEVVDVVAVRNGLVAAGVAVDVAGVVTIGIGRAVRRVLGIDLDYVLVCVVLVRVMQVTLMQVVDVAFVSDSGVPAAGLMLMFGVRVNAVFVHRPSVGEGVASSQAGESEKRSYMAAAGRSCGAYAGFTAA